jgi:hypothetical protein
MDSLIYFGQFVKHHRLKQGMSQKMLSLKIFNKPNAEYVGRLERGTLEESFPVEFDADINITSLGFIVGYKLPISKKLSIDFLIAGPGRGFYNFKLTNRKDLPDEFYEDLNNALDKFSLFDLIDGDFRFESTNSKTKFNRLSFRYGISMGYSF